ncbi:MAG: AAA family ATPase [Acidobacteria bacterium]|nr:AAA family ATPase [Acidobacteriota bacterium]
MKRTRYKPWREIDKPDHVKESDEFIERSILKGMITSTEFLEWMVEHWNSKLIDSTDIKKIGSWCLDHLKKYDEAPDKQIMSIFVEKRKAMRPENWVRIIDILTSLSKEDAENPKNINQLIDQTQRYFKEQRQRILHEDLQQALETGDIEGYEKQITKYQENNPLVDNSLATRLESNIITADEFINLEVPKTKRILYPWLEIGSINEIVATKGLGKTWLGLGIATAITRRNIQDIQIGPWEVYRKAGVLYIDGEMQINHMQERVKELEKAYGPMSKKRPLWLLSASHFANQYDGASINITSADWRDTLYDCIKAQRNKYRVLILDNLSALTPGIDENPKLDWDPINQWLLKLRHLGITVIFMHHTGKSGDQRGTSGREDAVDCVLKLTRPAGWTEECGAFFKISFNKARHLKGDQQKSFCLEIVENPDGEGLIWREREETATRGKTDREGIIADLVRGLSGKDIASKWECSDPYISKVKRQAISDGYLNKNGKPTQEGRELVVRLNDREGCDDDSGVRG